MWASGISDVRQEAAEPSGRLQASNIRPTDALSGDDDKSDEFNILEYIISEINRTKCHQCKSLIEPTFHWHWSGLACFFLFWPGVILLGGRYPQPPRLSESILNILRDFESILDILCDYVPFLILIVMTTLILVIIIVLLTSISRPGSTSQASWSDVWCCIKPGSIHLS